MIIDSNGFMENLTADELQNYLLASTNQ